MGHILFAVFNLIGGLVITTMLILSVMENTPYPKAVGIVLALLIGGALIAAGAGLPMHLWWTERREDLREGGGERS